MKINKHYKKIYRQTKIVIPVLFNKFKIKTISTIDSFLYLHKNKQYDDHNSITLCFSGC
jgi:hypothetical protein